MTAAPARLPIVDALRGFAVVQMIVYHFIYDLDYFGWVDLAMNRDQPWVLWRTLIVTQFLLLVGVSLVLRDAYKPGVRDFWRRWAEVAGAAALVSIGSWLVFESRFIWFGILHFVAAALILGRLLLPLKAWCVPLGVAAIVAGVTYRHEFFGTMLTSVVGFAHNKPRTEDYVPLFPWLGVVLVGMGLAALWQQRGFPLTPALQRLNAAVPRVLVVLGTWALTVYLVHQPLLMVLLWTAKQLG
ncbi:MAG: heparan-alpha-glucosaminide N-acetyltransferase [Betaproteobacteria bacterium]|jgi:uncharacterized membrane protein